MREFEASAARTRCRRCQMGERLFAGEIGDVGVKKGESLKTLQAIVTINQGHRNSEERI